MKSIVVYTGFILLIINLIAFSILSGFKIYPFVASEICIASSMVFFILLLSIKIDDAFKIFSFFAFGIAFAIKYITAQYIIETIQGSIPFILLTSIVLIEVISIFIFKQVSRHR